MMKFQVFVNGPFRTNTYLVYDEDTRDCFIIDPAKEHQPLMDEIRHLKLTPSHIILTHGHSDHTGGIKWLKESFPDIILLASVLEKDLLLSRRMSFGPGDITADIYVKDGESFSIGSLNMSFISTPGHTPGGMCIYFEKEKLLFSGDTLFFGTVGRSDLHGGDGEKLIESVKTKLLVLPEDVKVFPGHEEPTTIAYEKQFNPFV